jgi:hypothetical protein
MPINPETQALIKRFDDATTAAANRIQQLLDEIAADALSPETKAGFEAVITRLQGLGANPSDPVPPQQSV